MTDPIPHTEDPSPQVSDQEAQDALRAEWHRIWEARDQAEDLLDLTSSLQEHLRYAIKGYEAQITELEEQIDDTPPPRRSWRQPLRGRQRRSGKSFPFRRNPDSAA